MNNGIFTKAFWRATAERSSSTVAQTLIGILTSTAVAAIDWRAAAVTIAVAGGLAVLKAIVAAASSGSGSPSLGDQEVLPKSGS